MPAGIEEFNEETQRAKVAAGFKGGPYFKTLNTAAPMTFVDGVPSEVNAKFMGGTPSGGSISTPWNSSRQGSK